MMNEKGPLHFSRETWVSRGYVDAPRWEVKGGGELLLAGLYSYADMVYVSLFAVRGDKGRTWLGSEAESSARFFFFGGGGGGGWLYGKVAIIERFC